MGTGFFGIQNKTVRDAWVAEQIRSLPDGTMILDAGSGTQPYRPLCERLQYKTQDFAAYDGVGDGQGQQSQGWRYGQIDYVSEIWKIPASSESFDAILCTEVFEHIPYPNETLAEFSRLLKPGGVLLITVPFASTIHMSPYFFYSGFSEEYFRRVAPENGLQIERIERNGDKMTLALQLLLSLEEAIHSRFARLAFRLSAVPVLLLLRMLRSGMNPAVLEEAALGLHVRAVKRPN